jgi:hypothetical protein
MTERPRLLVPVNHRSFAQLNQVPVVHIQLSKPRLRKLGVGAEWQKRWLWDVSIEAIDRFAERPWFAFINDSNLRAVSVPPRGGV